MIPFGVILFALSSVISAAIASRVLFGGATLEAFEGIYATVILLALLVFCRAFDLVRSQTAQSQTRGLIRYGSLASRYTQLFERKWVDGSAVDEPLLGSADIQSLADLGNSYELVRKMRLVPVELSDFIAIALPGVLPALPLVATVVPLEAILKGILRLLG